jgi:hypothetical protein
VTELVESKIRYLTDLDWVTDSMVDRLSASGDTTGIPYYHYRWKKKEEARATMVQPVRQEAASCLIRRFSTKSWK